MLYNASSLFSQVLVNYSNYVFGSYSFAIIFIFLLFFIIGALIKIPLAINLSIYIPLSIILMAMGILPVIVGASLVIILMVLVGISIVSNF